MFSEETKRKWRIFRKKKKAYYSAVILSFMLLSALFAELYANSRPLL
ncbi:MAG: ABC transporter permease, partial [Oligoflexales bacterium]|nr:ABC transporter permease [Oligoflexales bacterium]